MKIWLEKGKQKELLKKEKELRQVDWASFANLLNIPFSKLHSFVYEETLIDEITFNKLRLNQNYKKFIIEKLPENWGQIKGGKLSPGKLKSIQIPKKNEKLAEFWGILLGDGNVQKRKAYKIGTYNINVAGHSVLDKDYLLNFVKPLGEELFGTKGRYSYSKVSQCLHIFFDGLNIVEFFEREGFKPGDKIKNQSTIPDWIKENPKYLAACLRGLLDTDGSFYKLTNQNSYQVCFTNKNFALLNDFRNGVLSLGIGCSKISKGKDITITKKSEIAKFYKVIGFHNSKHINKIKVFMQNLAPW